MMFHYAVLHALGAQELFRLMRVPYDDGGLLLEREPLRPQSADNELGDDRAAWAPDDAHAPQTR